MTCLIKKNVFLGATTTTIKKRELFLFTFTQSIGRETDSKSITDLTNGISLSTVKKFKAMAQDYKGKIR